MLWILITLTIYWFIMVYSPIPLRKPKELVVFSHWRLITHFLLYILEQLIWPWHMFLKKTFSLYNCFSQSASPWKHSPSLHVHWFDKTHNKCLYLLLLFSLSLLSVWLSWWHAFIIYYHSHSIHISHWRLNCFFFGLCIQT